MQYSRLGLTKIYTAVASNPSFTNKRSIFAYGSCRNFAHQADDDRPMDILCSSCWLMHLILKLVLLLLLPSLDHHHLPLQKSLTAYFVMHLLSNKLWNKLPASFRQANPDHSFSHSSQPNCLSSSVPSSPLSLSITPTFFHSKLKRYLFLKPFPP